MNTYAYDGFMAFVANFGEFFGKAIAADWVSFAFVECDGCDWFFTHQAHKMLWMPALAQGCQSLRNKSKRQQTTDN